MIFLSDCLKTSLFVIKTRLLHDKTVRNDTSDESLRGALATKQSRIYVFLNNHKNLTIKKKYEPQRGTKNTKNNSKPPTDN